MTKMRREFSPEFKREAVALLESSGRPLMQVATEGSRRRCCGTGERWFAAGPRDREWRRHRVCRRYHRQRTRRRRSRGGSESSIARAWSVTC